MKTLHTVNKPGHPVDLCFRAVASGDTVLLIEDAVYELMSPARLDTFPEGCLIKVLGVDASARGVCVPDSFEVMDYDGFVALSVEHDKVVSWF